MFKANEQRRNLTILSFTLVVVMLGFGLVIPIFPFYIENLGAGGLELGLLVATSALLEFVCAPVWGGISDRTGRRPVLMIGITGYGLSSLLLGLSTQLWMLFAARALSGVLSSATLVAAMAYVGDSTAEEDRGKGMGYLGAAMALGIIIGPGLGGWLAGGSLSRPFFTAAAFSFFALLLIFLFLPESLPAVGRKSADVQIRPVNLGELWGALSSPIGVLLFMVALFSFALTNFESVFGLYALEKFAYGPEQVGTILMVIAIVSTVGKVTLIGPATKRWGEVLVIKGSLLAGSVGFIVLLLAEAFMPLLLATAFFILSKTLLRPATLALISKRTMTGQGTAMGLSSSFASLGRIAGPIWAGILFDVHLNLPYLSGSVIMLAAFILSLVLIAPDRGETAVGKAAI